MGIITSINVQKKQPNRLSVFIDGQYAFGIDKSLKEKFNIHIGRNFDMSLLPEIETEDRVEQAYHKVLDFLAYRERCEFEVKEWMFRKGYQDIGDLLINRLRSKNYLNDARYTGLFIRDKIKLNKWGPLRIRQELLARRIKGDIISETMDRIISEYDFFQMATEIIEKKYKHIKNPALKDKKRLWSLLKRRGFDNRVIADVLESYSFESFE